MGLPEWLNVGKIAGLGLIIMSIVQYIKALIPEKWIRPATILIGVVMSIGAEFYIGVAQINWVRAIIDGILAAVLADTGYQFLSNKGGSNLSLPSKELPK